MNAKKIALKVALLLATVLASAAVSAPHAGALAYGGEYDIKDVPHALRS
jgi:hypothetical protein